MYKTSNRAFIAKATIILSTFFFSLEYTLSQGNDPCSAVSLSVNTSCSSTSGTTVGATYSNNAVNGGSPSCGSSGSPDVWYSFVAPTSGNVTISTQAGTITDGVMSLYSATNCNTSLTQLECDDDDGVGSMPEIIRTGLTGGATYYIRFWNYGSTGTGTFNICITSPTPPVNDLCSSATPLPCGTTNLAGSTNGSSNTVHGTGCSMSNFGVWYTFVGDGNLTTISTNPSFDIKLSISTGSCGSLTNTVCLDSSPESATFTATNGVTYFIYVAHYSSGSTTTGNFTISRTCVTTPVNDLCSGATSLPCGTTNLAGSTIASTNTVHGSGCSMSNYGVWYTFVGDGNQTTISVDAASGYDHGLSIARGSCGSLTNIACLDNAGSGGIEEHTFTTTNGVTYFVYIAHYSSGNTTTGNFTISRTCVSSATNSLCSTATPLPCGTTNLSGTTIGSSNTAPNIGCSISNYGVWYSFVGDGSVTTISTDAASGFDQELAIASGSCGSLTNIECIDDGSSGDVETYSFNAVSGVTYYIYVANYSSGSSSTGNFTISRTCVTPTGNNLCSGATNLPCGTASLAGTTNGTLAVTPNVGCSISENGVWYTFVGDGQQTTITNVAASGYDQEIAIAQGNCSSLSNLACIDDAGTGGTESYTFTTTNGVNYFVYVAHYSSGNTTTGNFTISRTCTAAPTPPTNNECTSATNLTVNPSTTCTSQTAGTVLNATGSIQTNNCGGSANNDVWYSFTATSTNHFVSLNSISGSSTDMYHAVYSGTCATPGTPIMCSDPNSSTLSGLTIGNTYLVRVYTYGSSAANTTFNVCITTTPPTGACGNQLTNDYCDAPATLTPGPGSWSSSTASSYTYDIPANLSSEFCGVINNNSYYQFIATATTAQFDFVSITGCIDGIQAEVYNVTTNASGCCTNFTSVSDCWNPWDTDPYTLTATGLVVGQRYILMVDGWAGANCNFTVANWTAIGILPVELIDFTGVKGANSNMLIWNTKSERENDHFLIERSTDGYNFEEIATVDAKQNSNEEQQYHVIDSTISLFEETYYYRLVQFDLDGNKKILDVLAISREIAEEGIIAIYPNPANSVVNVEINSKQHRNLTIEIINNQGQVCYQNAVSVNGFKTELIDIQSISEGLYTVRIYSEDKSLVENQKLIIKK